MSNKHWNAKQIIADWKFGPRFTEGSIADGSLVIKDQSGNGNDLQCSCMQMDSLPRMCSKQIGKTMSLCGGLHDR